jgi:hypothetical protein
VGRRSDRAAERAATVGGRCRGLLAALAWQPMLDKELSSSIWTATARQPASYCRKPTRSVGPHFAGRLIGPRGECGGNQTSAEAFSVLAAGARPPARPVARRPARNPHRPVLSGGGPTGEGFGGAGRISVFSCRKSSIAVIALLSSTRHSAYPKSRACRPRLPCAGRRQDGRVPDAAVSATLHAVNSPQPARPAPPNGGVGCRPASISQGGKKRTSLGGGGVLVTLLPRSPSSHHSALRRPSHSKQVVVNTVCL